MTKEKITPDKIIQLRKELKQLSQKDNSKTTKEVIELLADEIKNAQEKGYSLEEICNFFAQRDIDIKLSTLKSYLKKNNKGAHVQEEAEKMVEVSISENSVAQSSAIIIPDTPDNDL